MRRPCALLLAIALLAARPAAAGIELASTTGANYLSVGPGASLSGMGGIGIAGYPDLSGMAWNPAALGLMNESQLMFTHMPLPNSVSQDWMAFGGRMGEVPTRFALSGRYVSDGSFKSYDALGNLAGTFNASSLVLGVNAAHALGRHAVLGVGAKFVNENQGAISGYGGTFDMGVIYSVGPLSLGAAAQNLGGSVDYDSLAYSMPFNFGTGLALRSEKTGLSASFDFNHPDAYYDDVRTGAEWMWKHRMALRIGYRQELNAPSDDPMSSVSAGFGFGGHGMWFDYAFVASGDGTRQQRLTLRVSPKDWGLGFGADLDSPDGSSGSTASSAPPARQPSTASTGAGTPANAKPTASTSSASPGAAASTPVASASATSAPAAALPAAASTKATAAASSGSAKTAAPTNASAAPAKPKTVSPSSSAAAPAPELATLVPVTPPAVPAPKPVAASRPSRLPAVSAPAPQPQPSEAPVTAPANNAAAAAPQSKAKPDQPGEAFPPAVAPAPAATPAVASPPVIESATAKDGKPVRIRVKKDETLESIAKRFGTTKTALMMENNLVNEQIRPGQELKIPNHR